MRKMFSFMCVCVCVCVCVSSSRSSQRETQQERMVQEDPLMVGRPMHAGGSGPGYQ